MDRTLNKECDACMSMLNLDIKVYKGERYISVFFFLSLFDAETDTSFEMTRYSEDVNMQ